jgi:peptide/nickel transport system substrate-binding protein
LGPKGYVPDAAVAVPTVSNRGISRDGLTITYHLRHAMHWQDGQPLTARDVLFTLSVVMNPHIIMPYRDGFDRVTAISAPDPYTVVVRLRRPYRLFVMYFLGPESPTGILPEHLLANVADIPRSAYASMPVGSGPYRITSWRHGESVRFEADPGWYGGQPSIRQIIVRFLPDPTTRLTQLRTHEIDAELGVSSQTADQARNIPGLRVDAENAPIFMHLSFNMRDAFGSQLPIRLAVAQAIDTQTIAAKVSHGLFSGRNGGRGLYLWAFDSRAGYPVYDPRAAERRLDAAGWHRGTDGIRRDAGGRRLAFTISLRSDRADDNAAAVQVQQELRLVGIDIALKTYSAPQFTANDGVIRSGRFSADLLEYFADIEPDPTIFFACADRGMNGFNESAYCDSSADADMYASFVTADPNIVRHLLSRVQRRINAAMPTRFLWQGVDVNIVPVRLKHFSDLLGLPFSNVGTWQL